MDLEKIAADLRPNLKGKLLLQEPMKNHTTWKVGGIADLLITAKSKSDIAITLKYANENRVPCCILGNGSNVLVLDQGIRGIVLKLAGGLNQVTVQGQKVIAEAGARLPALAKTTYKHGLSGLEFLAAIPGLERILWGGGAIIMVYLGWGGIKDFWQHKEINLEEDSPKPGTGMVRSFSLGMAMAVINPYALMWYITAGGAYVSTGLAKAGLLGGIASVGSFLFGVSLWLALLIFGIHKAKRLITPTTMRIISGVSGIALWSFAAWFALNFKGM